MLSSVVSSSFNCVSGLEESHIGAVGVVFGTDASDRSGDNGCKVPEAVEFISLPLSCSCNSCEFGRVDGLTSLLLLVQAFMNNHYIVMKISG